MMHFQHIHQPGQHCPHFPLASYGNKAADRIDDNRMRFEFPDVFV